MSKKKRSREDRKSTGVPSKRTDGAWDDVEQAFFASAPPDSQPPPAQPERFDDLELVPIAPVHRRPRAELREALATIRRLAGEAATTPWLTPRNVTIAIASLVLLIGLSAVVFASR